MTSCNQYGVQDGQSLSNVQRHLPLGMAWDAARTPGKVLYKLLSALARSLDDMTRALCNLVSELNPYSTVDLLPEWETAVSLPDPCLPRADTLAERRTWVVWRLSKRRWTTAADWHDLAALFGLEIRITPGWLVQRPALFDACFDHVFWDFPKLGRFRVYIDIVGGCGGDGFDYAFDHPFPTTSPNCQALMCLIERVCPANVVIIWNADPVGNGWLTCGA